MPDLARTCAIVLQADAEFSSRPSASAGSPLAGCPLSPCLRPELSSRKQLSMVLPVELIAAIKQRASERGLSITAYVVDLVQADLGQPVAPNPVALAEQIQALQRRVEQLEVPRDQAP